jgi:hypothetical protein
MREQADLRLPQMWFTNFIPSDQYRASDLAMLRI